MNRFAFLRNSAGMPAGLPAFFAKAATLLLVVLAVGRLSVCMPAAILALSWAILSAATVIALAYPAVMDKIHRRQKLQEGGSLARLNEGRVLRILLAFVAASVLVAGLLLEIPRWGAAEVLICIAAVPAYACAYSFARQRLAREFKQPYLDAHALKVAGLVTGVFMLAAYALACLASLAQPAAAPAEAYVEAFAPYDGAATFLYAEAGKIAAMVDSLTLYGATVAASANPALLLAARAFMAASAFFGVSALLGIAVLNRENIAFVFGAGPAAKRSVALFVALPLALCVGAVAANGVAKAASETQEYTWAERVVRQQMPLAVYALDGKLYDAARIVQLQETLAAGSQQLAAQAADTMIPLINASFDARVANVDNYLDWYYSLPADYERLLQAIGGSSEERVAQRLAEKLGEGVDDSALEAQLAAYANAVTALATEALEQLAHYDVSALPGWMVQTTSAIDLDFLMAPLDPVKVILNVESRFAFSAAVGMGAGLITKYISAGAAAGTLAGPAGTAAGIAAGTVAGLAVDAFLLSADEVLNRENYRADIIVTLEGARKDALALFAA